MSKLRAKRLWSQIIQRKVVHVAFVYVVAGWVLTQVGEWVFEVLETPSWSLSLLVFLIIAGLPLALVLTWLYEVTPHGIRRDSSHHIESVTHVEDGLDEAPSIAVVPFTDVKQGS